MSDPALARRGVGEAIMVSLRTFFDEIVEPNVQIALQEPGNARHAVNAVFTIDALVGMLYVELRRRNDVTVSNLDGDDKYRDALADRDESYRILRDLAAAYKHGELTFARAQARLVMRPDQVVVVRNAAGLMQMGDKLGGSVLVIEVKGNRSRRASSVIADSYRMLKELTDAINPRPDVFGPESSS